MPRDGFHVPADRERRVPDGGTRGGSEPTDERVIVLNPESGDGTHVDETYTFASQYGYTVYETQRAGHGVDLTEEAIADGAEVIAAAGGDGTVNEVVSGIHEAGAFDDVTLGVLPGGTGNNFALTIGIETIEAGFEAIEHGRVRHVDIGTTAERPFINSCVGGLTAEASSEVSSDLKQRFGVLAYVLATLRELADFEGLEVSLDSRTGDETLWEGSAVSILIGNARRVGEGRIAQADMEDGLFDVTIVEAMPTEELLSTAAVYRLFGEDRDSVTRLKTPSLEVVVEEHETVAFSLDGEILHVDRLSAAVRSGVLSLCVGEAYEPHPDGSESGM